MDNDNQKFFCYIVQLFCHKLKISMPIFSIFSGTCDYSSAWHNKFKKHHKLCLVHAFWEAANFEAANAFSKGFEDTVIWKHLPQRFYNADEIVLFWHYVPRKTYVLLEETSASGFKDFKEILFWHAETLLETQKC